MPFNSIVMHYKQNCKIEGEVITKLKVARLYFSGRKTQKEIAENIGCHYNTVNNIIKKCKSFGSSEAFYYLETSEKLSESQLGLFDFLKSNSRRPKSNKRSLGGTEEALIIWKYGGLNYGPKRMFKHLKRQGYDVHSVYTLSKIKGVYKRNKIRVKKIRTANGERRALYNYEQIGAFEYLQYDVKYVADKHSLPAEIYRKFKFNDRLPNFQWTVVDAKSKTRFLAWSYSLDSFFGLKFLEFVICWIRAHNIRGNIYVQIDGGPEMCSGSKRKLDKWNEQLSKYGVEVYDTEGSMWRQNLVERTHRTDDEEFYCPRGEFIETKNDFLIEGQHWIIYHNNRSSDGIGLNGLSPKEKLEQLGIYNAKDICNFPCLILEDFFEPLRLFFNVQKSQNVLTSYR